MSWIKARINVSCVNHSLMGMNFRQPPLNHYWPITFIVNETPRTSALNWCTTSPMRYSINTRRRDAATMLSNRASGIKSNLHVTRVIAIAVNRLDINVSLVHLSHNSRFCGKLCDFFAWKSCFTVRCCKYRVLNFIKQCGLHIFFIYIKNNFCSCTKYFAILSLFLNSNHIITRIRVFGFFFHFYFLITTIIIILQQRYVRCKIAVSYFSWNSNNIFNESFLQMTLRRCSDTSSSARVDVPLICILRASREPAPTIYYHVVRII